MNEQLKHPNVMNPDLQGGEGFHPHEVYQNAMGRTYEDMQNNVTERKYTSENLGIDFPYKKRPKTRLQSQNH